MMNELTLGGVDFYGMSGRTYRLKKLSDKAAWPPANAVFLFVARDGFGWRAIDAAALGPREDFSLFVRWRQARRHGATAVFVKVIENPKDRADTLLDLKAALEPVVSQPQAFSEWATAA